MKVGRFFIYKHIRIFLLYIHLSYYFFINRQYSIEYRQLLKSSFTLFIGLFAPYFLESIFVRAVILKMFLLEYILVYLFVLSVSSSCWIIMKHTRALHRDEQWLYFIRWHNIHFSRLRYTNGSLYYYSMKCIVTDF